MSTLSIRKMPKEIEKALIHDAKKKGKTKTDIVIEALQEKYHLEPLSVKCRSIREFFGKMTSKEYQEFLDVTQPLREVDQEMWK